MRRILFLLTLAVAAVCLADSVTNEYRELRRVPLGTYVHVDNLTNELSDIAYALRWDSSTNFLLAPVYANTMNEVGTLREVVYQEITNLAVSGITVDGHTYRLVEVVADEEEPSEDSEEAEDGSEEE